MPHPPSQTGPDGADPPGGPTGGGGAPGGVLNLQQLLVSSIQDYAIFVLDPDGRVLSWNPGAERVKGYAADEIVGRHFSIFYPPEAKEQGRPGAVLAAAASNGSYQEEGWRLRKDGGRFWASVTVTALRDDTDTLVGFAKITRDLTERKKAEEAIRRSEERFRLLVQNVMDYGIFMLDPGGHVVSWNEGAERIKGYTRDEILGRHFSTFYREEDLAWDKPGMELEVAGQEGRFEDEGWRVRKDGSLFWANVVITTLRNDAGELVGFAKVTRDLTERRAAELKAIEDARRVAEAEAESRAKSELLATMSHELRTPLNAIGGYVDLLNMGIYGPVSKDQEEVLERVQAGQRHLLQLINELLNFASVEGGEVTYDLGPVVLTEVLDDVEGLVGPQASDRGIEIEWHGAAEGAVALADRARVEQILLNLVTNAVKYTEPGGRVRVRPLVREDQVLVEVSDTGMGIEEQHREAIFQPFTQIGRSLTSPHEGTGLGLAISRDLARAMGGDITVRSTVGEGSTFTLSLPRPDGA